MNAITKSGTNKFHGTLFEYVRNQIFDAPGYFAKTLPPYHRNQFGGTIGGPILRNHAFFFFAYQGTRESSTPTVETFTSPDTAERSGNFSEISKQLKDPTTGKPVPGNIFTTQLNKASLAFLNAFVPLPNSAKNIYSYSPATFLNDDQYIGRLDTQITRNNHLFGRILEDTNAQDSQNSSTDLPGFLTNVDYTNWSLAVNDTHTFSPTLLNQFIFGFDDIVRLQLPVLPSQTTWGDLGAGVVRAASGPIGYDTRVQGGYFTAETRWPLNQYRHNFQYSDTLSWTRGKHEIYLGGDLRSMYAHQYQDFQSDGQFIFAAVYTGNQLADFETGHELSFSQESFNAGEPVNLTPDLFVQDNWKATARLTANLGLRWNPWVAYHDQFNEISQFIPGQQSTVYLKAPVGYVFPGDAGISQNTINNSWHDFAPRVGLAYDVFGDGKTSLRAGYGIYYAFVRMQALNSFSLNQPYGIILTVARPTGGMTNPYANTGNPFPYTPPQTAQAKAAYQFQLPLTLTVWDPNFQDARIDQWNVNIQQQVRNWIFTIAYVGSAGEHLEFQFERDPAVYGAPGVTEQDRRIFAPNFGSITDQFSGGHSSYDALQLTANRRFSRGFTLLANSLLSD